MAKKSSDGKTKKRLSLKRKLIYSLAVYVGLGSCIDKTITTPIFPLIGNACYKNYLPLCLDKNRGNLLSILLPKKLEHLFVKTNSLGYVGKMKNPKPNNVFRTICFGGSTTFFPIHNDYPSELEKLLNNKYNKTGISHEVINAGLYGYSVIEIESQLRREITALDANVVIVSEPWNFSLMQHFKVYGHHNCKSGVIGQIPLYPIISLFIVTKKLKDNLPRFRLDTDNLNNELEEYMQYIQKIHYLTKDAGITLVLGIHPDSFNGNYIDDGTKKSYKVNGMDVYIRDVNRSKTFKRMISKRIREYSAQNGIEIIDWESEFEKILNVKDYFLSDYTHPNVKGAKTMAEISKKKIEQIVAEKYDN